MQLDTCACIRKICLVREIPPVAKRLRIALLIESSRQYPQQLQRGIAAYAQAHGPWSFYHQMRALGDAAPAWLKSWGCHGILARIESAKMARQIKKMHLPTVDLYGMYDIEGVCVVDNDNQAIAELAAKYLIERGFRNFAYCGFPGIHYSDQRCKYFVQFLAEAGYEVSTYDGPPRSHAVDLSSVEVASLLRERELANWLESLPKPLGLFACDDSRAQQVLNACGQYNIAVPDEVAVIGADNDEPLCELSDPPLSSIDSDAQRIGYEGACALHRLIEGEKPPSSRILIGPKGVVVRQSTNVIPVADSRVAAAMHFIRQHACDGIVVDDVLRHVRVSRSTLERRFADAFDRSPRAEIHRIQIQRVKELLKTTDFSLAKIARLAGFNHTESLCYSFKNATGLTPGQFRKQ
jgi:LacI family transcriptional regulator